MFYHHKKELNLGWTAKDKFVLSAFSTENTWEPKRFVKNLDALKEFEEQKRKMVSIFYFILFIFLV